MQLLSLVVTCVFCRFFFYLLHGQLRMFLYLVLPFYNIIAPSFPWSTHTPSTSWQFVSCCLDYLIDFHSAYMILPLSFPVQYVVVFPFLHAGLFYFVTFCSISQCILISAIFSFFRVSEVSALVSVE